MDIVVATGRGQSSLAATSALLLVALAACGPTRATTGPATAQAPVASPGSPRPSAALPAGLPGVWFRDDPGGHAQCERYRALPADAGKSGEGGPDEGGADEAWMSMVGSLVITPGLIHAFSEYGEGNFNVVREIESEGDGRWRVEVQVGIDAMPVDGEPAETDSYRMELHRGRLGWGPLDAGGAHASTFFRCGDVRGDVYRVDWAGVDQAWLD